jgi:lipopolysaccharide biosynthesis protein
LRSIAFYLPQYHPIPENDAWWGVGFTEWTKTVTPRPRFRGHYQPHIPADLGFYDLRLPESRAAQAGLAGQYRVDGFCYYHYWFNGKRLLERPFEEVLRLGEPDFPFMLCWANENWSRTWDGAEHEVLIAQRYSPEDDRRHIQSLLPAFKDPRYITIEGRPVFLVYRASALPDPIATTGIWRTEVQRAGLPDPYLCRVEQHGADRGDPRLFGFDAGVEFMPDVTHLGPRVQPSRPGRAVRRILRPRSGFRWNLVHEYDDIVTLALAHPKTPYVRFRCVMPSWDNSARREQWAWIYRGSTPETYGEWLKETLDRFTLPSAEEDLVFTNAWNEWGEGNHLEPDLRWGRAYLEAHARAMAASSGATSR